MGVDGMFFQLQKLINRECELSNKTLVISIYGLLFYNESKQISYDFRGDLGTLYMNIKNFLEQLISNSNKLYLLNDFYCLNNLKNLNEADYHKKMIFDDSVLFTMVEISKTLKIPIINPSLKK